jgi:5-methylcytosine-specific restriction protein A
MMAWKARPHGQVAGRRRSPDRRPTAAQRGYGYRWQQYARRFLLAQPLCRECQQHGRVTAATCVDHIMPVASADDPLFWDAENHQPLCQPCHSAKTNSIDRHSGRASRRSTRS